MGGTVGRPRQGLNPKREGESQCLERGRGLVSIRACRGPTQSGSRQARTRTTSVGPRSHLSSLGEWYEEPTGTLARELVKRHRQQGRRVRCEQKDERPRLVWQCRVEDNPLLRHS